MAFYEGVTMDMSQIIAEAKEKVEAPQEETIQPQEVENIEETTETAEAPEAPVETEPEETVKEPEKPAEQGFDPKFEVLKRREKALREREQHVKEFEKQQKQTEQDKELAQKDPLAYLEKMGLTYEKLTDAMLGNEPSPDSKVSEIEQRLQKFEEAERQKALEVEQQKAQQQINEYTELLNKHIDSSEKYELLKASKSHQLVVDTIIENYNQTQEELDWDVACDVVEDYLWKTEIGKLKDILKIEKVRQELGLSEQTDVSEPEVKRPATTKTLSNSNTSTVPERHQAGEPMTFKEALERAKVLEEELFKKT